jgi:hypothetical protein
LLNGDKVFVCSEIHKYMHKHTLWRGKNVGFLKNINPRVTYSKQSALKG